MDALQTLLDAIRESCSPRTWSRGVELVRGGAVALARQDDAEAVLRVSIAGKTVSPTVTLWPPEEDWSCDCGGSEDPCAHIAAAAIALKRGLSSAKEEGRGPMEAARVGYRLDAAPQGLRLCRVLVVGDSECPLQRSLVSADASGSGSKVAASRQDMQVELALGQRVQGGELSTSTLKQVLTALQGCDDVRLDGQPVTVGPPRSVLRVVVEDDGGGFVLRAMQDPEVGQVFGAGAVLTGDLLQPISTAPLSAAELSTLRAGRHFPPAAAGQLVAEVLPRLEAQLPVHIATKRLPRGRAEPPRLVLEVERQGDALRVLPALVYGVPPTARLVGNQMRLLGDARDAVPLRDEESEKRLQARLQRELKLSLGRARTLEASEAIAFSQRIGSQTWVEVEGRAHEQFYAVSGLHPDLRVGEREFTLSFQGDKAGGTEAGAGRVDARRLIEAWESGQTLVPLQGGGFAPLPADWLERFGDRVAALISMQDASTGEIAPAALPDLARLCEQLDCPAPPQLGRLRETLRGFSGLPQANVDGIRADLRDYQRQGVNWLCFMREAELGALLADDMGLGKTLQAICALQGKTLVVAPTSVLRNWQAEISRFRPTLSACVYHGPNRELDEQAEVVITSYAILRLDANKLCAHPWDTVVLDEAQQIRNAESQMAQAAFDLRATWRLALTGTPVENRLEDLWSLFHFLGRGLLGGRRDFQERYARPIADGMAGVAEQLRERTRPFILRRLKGQVAAELPPRTEVVLRCQLDDREREIYNTVRAATHQEVLRQLQLGKSNVIGALAALLRLRQAACHSALVPGQHASSSSKLELLLARVEEAVAEGHKALVFSQWTSLLDLIEPSLQSRDIRFCRLDGATRDRQAVVDEFQQPGGPPLMLASLKAGGVGLNLTEADHVFLMDPWWNPAAEDQAADRAHRIGQTKPVIVHKLVAEDTLEERILAMQQHKRAVAQAALSGTDQASGLTRDDLLKLLE